jgi:cytochrome c-type biogenesis protein CcmE
MKIKITIVIVAIAGAVAFMAGSSIKKDARKFYQLNELHDAVKTNPDEVNSKYLVVLGNVKEGTIRKNGVQADFIMKMGDVEMSVHHNGKNLLPDTFQDGAQVTIEGKYIATDNKFESDKVMAKCASKYQTGAELAK